MKKFKPNKLFWDLFMLILVVSGVSLITDGFEFKFMRITLCSAFLILLYTKNLEEDKVSSKNKIKKVVGK